MYTDTKFIGSVDKDEKTLGKELDETFYNANKEVVKKKDKHKMRGRSKIGSKLRAKQKNVIEVYKEKERQQVSEAFTEKQKAEKKKLKKGKSGYDQQKTAPNEEGSYNPLARFSSGNK